MGLMKKLTSVVVTAGLLLGLVGTAFASYPADSAASAKRMQDLGIVQGDPNGDLRLGDSITRAELVTIIVRAYGQEANAKLLAGAATFPDTANHWASGYIALANNIITGNGFTMGMPDGTFAPNGKVTAAQAIAFLMKFLGAPRDASKAWPDDYLAGAVAAGLLSADDYATLKATPNSDATRGLVFYLADTAFGSYKLSSGKTLYTEYVRPVAPTLTVDDVAPTTDSSATITGSVTSKYSDPFVVTVGSTTNVATVSNGKFSATVSDLAMGDNDVTVMVTDEAGNVVTKTVKVTRTAGAAAKIDAAASLTVAAGDTADLAIAVQDAKGNVVADVVPAATSDWGTWADGKFTAGQKAGTGVINVTAGDLTASVNVTVTAGPVAKLVLDPATVDLSAGGSQKFAVSGQDQFGNTVAVSNVAWSASKGIIGQDGSFGATTDATGTVTVTATAGTVSGTATVTVFGVATKITAAAPSNLVANGKSTGDLVISVLDANGNVAKNWSGTVSVTNANSSVIGAISTSGAAIINGTGTVTLTAGNTNGTGAISLNASGLTGYVASVTVAKQTPTSVQVTVDPATIAADNGSRATLNAKLLDQTGNPITSSSFDNQYSVSFAISDSSIVSGGNLDGTLAKDATDNVVESNQGSRPYVQAKNALGSVTITATVKYNGVASSTVTANSVSVSTALVGVPYKLAIDPISDAKTVATSGTTDNKQKVVVRVLDVNGNQVTGDNASSVSLSYTGWSTSTTLQSSTHTIAVGSGSAQAASSLTNNTVSGGKVTFYVTTNKIATLSYTATGTNTVNSVTNTLTQATATGNFVAGTASKLTISSSPSVIAANGSATSVLTAKVVDDAGNLVTTGSYNVKFSRIAGGNAVANWVDQTVASVNGVATVTVTGTTNTTDGQNVITNNNPDDKFQVSTTIAGASVNTNSYTTPYSPMYAYVGTRVLGVPNQLQFADSSNVLHNSGTYSYSAGTAGTASKVYVGVADANGNLASYDNSTVVTLTVSDSDGVAVGTYTATDVNGIATFSLTLNTKDTVGYGLKATATNLKGAIGTNAGGNNTASLVINAADAVGLKLTSNSSTLSADGGTSKATLKVYLVDAYGNTTTSGADLSGLSIDSSSSAVATVESSSNWKYYASSGSTGSTVAASSAHFATALVSATTNPGSATFTVSKSGLTSASTTITTGVVGSPTRVSVSVDSAYEATTSPSQAVTVTVLDANGNRVTNSTDYITITTDSTTAVVYADSNGTAITNHTIQLQANATTNNAGAYTFYVADTKAETVTYTAQLSTNSTGTIKDGTSAASASGTFSNTDMSQVGLKYSPKAVSTDTYASVYGDGSSVAIITVQVQDQFNNLVSDATGTAKVSISSGLDKAYIVGADSAGVLSVDIVGGQAVITVQTRDYASGNVGLKVQYFPTGSATAKYDTTFGTAINVLTASH